MKILYKKIRLSELFFYAALFVYISYYYITNSDVYTHIPNTARNSLKYLVLVLLVIKWLFTEKYTAKKLLLWVLVFGVVMLVVLKSDYKLLLITVCLAISAQDIDFRSVVVFILANTLGWTLVIVLGCQLGFLTDYTYTRRIGNITIAHSYGFNYYSSIGSISMCVVMMYLYIRKKCTYMEIGLVTVLTFILYNIHTVRLTFYMTLLYIVGYVIVVKLNLLKLTGILWKYIATFLPAALFGITFWVVYLYMKYGRTLNDILGIDMFTMNGRLDFTARAIEKYGISLLGSQVVQVGVYSKTYLGIDSSGFFVDSGYAYILIAYGILFTFLILFAYTLLYRYLYFTNQKLLFMWLSIILVGNMVNELLLSIAVNPFIFLLPKALFEFKNSIVQKKDIGKPQSAVRRN